MTDRGLIERFVRHKSEAAFSQLVQRHSGLVFATCKRDLGDAQLAEECTQAVFLILARKAGRLVRLNSLAGWLFKTARLASRDVIKREVRRRNREGVIMEHLHSQSEREDAAWRTIEPELNDSLQSLAAPDREVLLMRFVEQYSHAEIAANIGIKEDAARLRVMRAVERLRAKLTSRLGAGAGILAGIALADLLASRAADAAAPSVTAKLMLIDQWSSSMAHGTMGQSGLHPQAHVIAKGTDRAMLRTKTLTWGTAAIVAVIGVLIATHPHRAQAYFLPAIHQQAYATTASTAGTDAGPAAGYTETYDFLASGKEIGTETATLTNVTADEQTWTFKTGITVDKDGKTITIAENGTAAFSNTGQPDRLDLNATVAGINQVVSLDFTRQPVTLDANINGLPVTVAAPYQPGQF